MELGKKTILMVEDETITAMIQKKILEKYNYNVIVADNGLKAIEKAELYPNIDLILMDIDLGHGIDGTEAAKAILKDKEIPLIFISSHTEPEIVNKTDKISSYGYIVKNTGETVLIASIRMAFRFYEERKKSQEKEKLLQSMLKVIPDMISIHDKDMNIIYSNWKGIGDIPAEKRKLYSKCYKTYRNRDEICSDCNMQKAIQFKRSILTQMNWTEQTLVDFHIIPIFDENNEIKFLVEYVKDITKNKEYEDILKQYKTLFDEANFGMAISDLKGNLIKINDYMANIHGYTPEELIGKNLSIFHSSEQLKDVQKINQDFIKNRYFNSKEVWHIHKEGYEFPMIMNGFFIENKDKTKEFLAVSAIEISNQKQIEKLLLESREKYKNYIDNAPEGFFIVDEKGRYLEVNKAATDTLGYTEDEFLGMSIINILSDGFIDAGLSHFQRVKENGSAGGELKFKHKDGSEVYLSVNAIRLSENRFLAFTNDITELKHIQERMHSILNNITDAIWTVSYPDLKLDYYNDNFKKVYGRPAEDFMKNNQLWREITHPDDRHLNDEDLKNLLETGRTEQEFRIILPDGTIRWIYDRTHLIYDDKKNPIRIHGMARDITKRKKAEEKIHSLLAEKDIILKEANHRIKNNLNMVYAMLSLQGQNSDGTPASSILSDTANRVRSMSLLYDLIYKSQNDDEINSKEYLNNLIKTITNTLICDKDIKVHYDIDDFTGNTNILSRTGIILNELITNSYKHAFKYSDNPNISIYIKNNKDHILIEYEDNGTGIKGDIASSETLGFQLINALIQELKGNIKLELKEGTKISIILKTL